MLLGVDRDAMTKHDSGAVSSVFRTTRRSYSYEYPVSFCTLSSCLAQTGPNTVMAFLLLHDEQRRREMMMSPRHQAGSVLYLQRRAMKIVGCRIEL